MSRILKMHLEAVDDDHCNFDRPFGSREIEPQLLGNQQSVRIPNGIALRFPLNPVIPMNKPEILPAPVLNLPPPPRDKWEEEYHAFIRLLPELLETHRGKYVAIHEGHVVDSGDDKIALAMRAYDRFGYIPIYVGLVAERPLRPVRIPSPRLILTEAKE
jgi:hypothetical protein